jgi:hypothetical protein
VVVEVIVVVVEGEEEVVRGRERREEERRVKQRKKRDKNRRVRRVLLRSPGMAESVSSVKRGKARAALPRETSCFQASSTKERNQRGVEGEKVNFVSSHRRRRLPQTPL